MSNIRHTQVLLEVVREEFKKIGYRTELIRENYEYADLIEPSYQLQDKTYPLSKIDLAFFAQEPFSYRSSCLGFALPARPGPEGIEKYRFFGAPLIFSYSPEIGEDKIHQWKILATGKPEHMGEFDPVDFPAIIQKNKDEWNPNRILQAKSVDIQVDFYDLGLLPVIEDIVNKKLDQLMQNVIFIANEEHKKINPYQPINDEELFRLIFRLIAAKLLADRQYTGAGNPDDWKSPNVQQVLKRVEQFYFGTTKPEPVLRDERIQYAVWDKIRHSFQFQNLSVEALAYIYENTFVTNETRKQYSIHATPHEIAEYLVRQLPLEMLPVESRHVFEPFTGAAPFLIAALGRLRMLLGADASIESRHRYFMDMLSGMETDPFSLEVAKYSLIVADYPNSNGWNWDILRHDFFSSYTVEDYLRKAEVVLCNPPYESFAKKYKPINDQPSANMAATALDRVLQHAPKILGFVLPRVFLNGREFTALRRKLIGLYDNIQLVALPEGVFNHSDVEVVLLSAFGVHSNKPKWYSVAVEKRDYQNFIRTGRPTWKEKAPDKIVLDNTNTVIWYSPLQRLWESTRQLGEIADVGRGFEFENFRENYTSLISRTPLPNFVSGLYFTGSNFEPYTIKSIEYFNPDSNKRRRNPQLAWEKPKVIATARRVRVDRWVINAAMDEEGLQFGQYFHGIWPKTNLPEKWPIEVIAAIVNGPVANAFLSSQRTSRDNQLRWVEQIPIPNLSDSQKILITSLVREYRDLRKQWIEQPERANRLEARCRGILKQIDGELLIAYNFIPEHQRELIKYFEGFDRPGPVKLRDTTGSPSVRLFPSLLKVEKVREEAGEDVAEVVIFNWDLEETVSLPISLIPTRVRNAIHSDVWLYADINVGVEKAEELHFENIELAPDFNDV